MTWFSRRKPDPRETAALAAKIDAEIAYKETSRQLHEAGEAHARAVTLTGVLRQVRERNHFAESIEGLYREKRT